MERDRLSREQLVRVVGPFFKDDPRFTQISGSVINGDGNTRTRHGRILLKGEEVIRRAYEDPNSPFHTLPTEVQQLVVLRYGLGEGQTAQRVKDVARSVGLPTGTVGDRINRARVEIAKGTF